jgi:hypothetical protein
LRSVEGFVDYWFGGGFDHPPARKQINAHDDARNRHAQCQASQHVGQKMLAGSDARQRHQQRCAQHEHGSDARP